MAYQATASIPLRYPDGGQVVMYADVPVEDISQTFAANFGGQMALLVDQYATEKLWPRIRSEVNRSYLIAGIIVASGLAAWYFAKK